MNKKEEPVERWEKRAKNEMSRELSKKPYSIVLNIENVLALGKEIMKTDEGYMDNHSETISAEIHFALFQAAFFVYRGMKELPNLLEVDCIDEDEEDCLCDDCKRKKEFERITKEHEALVGNYIQ